MIDIILYQPEKPMNVGNIMRTAMASKSRLIIIGPISFSLSSKDVKRAGMDYIDDIDIIYYDDYEHFLASYNHNIPIYYVTRYSKLVYSSVDFSDHSRHIAFMFGRESSGIPHDILRKNEPFLIRIPMVSNARSLNLSNCVSIIVYHALYCSSFFGLSLEEEIKGNDFLFDKNKEN